MFFKNVRLHIDVAQILPALNCFGEAQSPVGRGRMACLGFSAHFITEELWAAQHLGPQLINHKVGIGPSVWSAVSFIGCYFVSSLFPTWQKRPIKSKIILK